MHITKLEVTGFKSFLEKTSFNFTSRVTGIVGPNGCGKSNVVDALKWVTGELSFKELRGHSTEDLIFAGSELRPPTGMAEVTLVLDNADGSAPAQYKDFAEVSVTRRIFRDGTSEFFINKTACRLRDIIDIFLDTGVGQSSYSIIEQGRVGMIVSSKPEDRRAIIEEAAGIEKYKNRKKAAQRKMEYTKQNLQRVADVLGELHRQIGSLERQARKAERFKEARTRAQELDLALSARTFLQLTQKSDELRKQELAQSDRYEAEQTELTAEEATLETERLKLLENEKRVQDVQQELFQSSQTISTLENRIETLKREGVLLAEQVQIERDRIVFLDQEEGRLTGEIARLDEALRVLHEEQASIQTTLQAAVDEQSTREHRVSEVEAEVEKAKNELLTSVAQEAELRNQVQTSRMRLADIERQLEVRQRELERAQAELVELEQRYTQQQTAIGLSQQLRFGFEREQGATRQRLDELQKERNAQAKQLAELNQKIEGQRSRLATLEEFERTYQGYKDGVRSLMERRKVSTETVGQVRGLLGEMIKTSRGYEKAVEAVLAERIECMVVEEPREALWAISYLKGEGRGRGAFLPKKLKFAPRQADLPSHPGVLGYLKDFIIAEEGCRESLATLLNDVIVVDSLPRALALWEDGIESTMVTADGDLITRQGIIVGGTWGAERGVLEQHREVEELRETHQEAQATRDGVERALVRLDQEIFSTTRELGRVDLELTRASRQTVDHEKDFERIEEGLRRARQSLSVIEDEKVRLQAEKQAVAEAGEASLAKLSEVEKLRADIETQVHGIQSRLNEARVEVQEHLQAVTTVKVREASVLERMEAFRREIQGYSDQIHSARDERELKRTLVEQHLREIDQKELDRVALDTDRATQILNHQEVQTKAEAERTAHDERAERVRLGMETIRVRHETIRKLSEEVSGIRMTLQEETLRLEHLTSQVRDKYAVQLSTIVAEPDFVPMADDVVEENETEYQALREKMSQIGDVNLAAIDELKELKERHEFLTTQKADLEQTLEQLSSAIRKINVTTRDLFVETFEAVNREFQELFPRLFQGGKARLLLTDPENLLETGVEIVAQPPGKRLQNMNLLSGGEKALTAVALIFAIFRFKAPPFCLLDEVDAPLDDINVRRFRSLVETMADKTQFIIITHNKSTMEIADNLYGVTMEEPGVSRTVSVRVHEMAAAQRVPAVEDARVVA